MPENGEAPGPSCSVEHDEHGRREGNADSGPTDH